MAEAHFDAVVVGSGFGGGVSALRLAEAGRTVCVLERGKRWPPGSFARSPMEMGGNFWDPSAGLQGLFDIWSFRGIEAVVSSGVGGGSLIYANVLLRKDPKWFVREDRNRPGYEYWPVTYDDLDDHYTTAEGMLGANRFPFHLAPYDATAKTIAMQDAAARMGADWDLPPLAVSFGTGPGEQLMGLPPNLHGATRFGCRLCGECDIGCNYGSKNTIDLTYLSAAVQHGAVVEDRCEVRRFEPHPQGGYLVTFVRHRPENEGVAVDTSRLPTESIRCKVLVLAAGALGSTYLLLRNRSALPALSRQLGTRFCGNGDALGFVVRSRSHVLDPSGGPVITSRIRVADAADDDGEPGVRGYYVQEGGYPEFANWIIETSTIANPAGRGLRFAAAMLWSRITNQPKSQIGVQLSALLGDARWSGATMPMLGMGRDIADGRMRLRRGWLDIDWTTATSKAFFARVRTTQAAIAAALDADFVENPSKLINRVVTVHPLGGCPMGRDEAEGVVDSHGEAFGHPGLFVADGSVMPGPVGANPSLTIAALAERFAPTMVARANGA